MPVEHGMKYVMGRGCAASRKCAADEAVGEWGGCSFVNCDPLLLSARF